MSLCSGVFFCSTPYTLEEVPADVRLVRAQNQEQTVWRVVAILSGISVYLDGITNALGHKLHQRDLASYQRSAPAFSCCDNAAT